MGGASALTVPRTIREPRSACAGRGLLISRDTLYTDSMPHIHTEPGQHDHTASVFLFRADFAEPRVILHLHKKLGTFMQFGGHVELDETPWQAIIHELREESGYEINQLQILQPEERLTKITDAVVHPQPLTHSTHQVIDGHFHTDSAYVMMTSEPPAHTPEDGESQNIQLFTHSQIEAMPKSQILENVREIILYAFDGPLQKWQPVSPKTFN